MKINRQTKIALVVSAAILASILLLAAINNDKAESSPASKANGIQAVDADKDHSTLTLENENIERNFEKLFLDYLCLDPSVLNCIQPKIEKKSNPFYERTRRIIEDEDMRTALAKAGQGLQYEVVRSGYADNASKTFAAELSVTYPDVGRAIRERFVGTGKTSAYFSEDGIADFIVDLDLGSLERNTGYLFVFYEKAVNGGWYLSSVSDPQKSSLSLTEFGGIQLHTYHKQKKQYPVYLPFGMAVEVEEQEFAAFMGAPDDKGIGAELNASAVDCINDVLQGLSQKRLNLIFTDNRGVLDATEQLRYLEDSSFGTELYTKYQMLDVDEGKAKRADFHLEYAKCNARYFVTEADGIKGYIVGLEYKYINRAYAEKLAYAKLGKSLGGLSVEEYRSFIEENKDCLLHTEFSTAQWWENEAIDADRMLLNNLVDLVQASTFG